MFGRAKKDVRGAGAPESAVDRSSALAMVLLEAPVALSTERLAAVWGETWPEFVGPTDVEAGGDDDRDRGGGDGAFACTLGPMHVAMMVMPMTIPNRELEGPAATSWLWPSAEQDIARVGAHVVVFVSGEVSRVEAHEHLTRLVTVVTKATGAMGVYQGGAGQVIQAEVYVSLAEGIVEQKLPVMLWVDFRCYVENGRTSLFTVGMKDLGLMDLEVPSSTTAPGDLRFWAMDIATYLMRQGPVINDGDTVGATADERIVVTHGPSMIDRPDTVYSFRGC